MSSYEFYPQDITVEEKNAGFCLYEVDNPKAVFDGQPEKIGAVIFQTHPSYRVIKLRDPDGVIEYKLQKYGRLARGPRDTEPQWVPVGMLSDQRPNQAVANIQRHVDLDDPIFEVCMPTDDM